MKIFIQSHDSHAGKWIYRGYSHAWIYKGFSVEFINSLSEVKIDQPYYLMITESLIDQQYIDIIENSEKTILYVSANKYPDPWGSHPNWISSLNFNLINDINQLKNVIKWNFSDINKDYFYLWNNVYSVPLAFDSINYRSDIKLKYDYDICYIGSIANNGFNEKIEIIKKTLDAFLKTNLRCAFAVNANLTHEQENYLLNNSKIALNVHDAYQRTLGLDTNERTFKGLGCNGILVSDKIDQLNRIFPDVFTSNCETDLVSHCQKFIQKDVDEINYLKNKNQTLIQNNHSYINRIEYFLSL
jgi:hypothetical protein